MRLGLIAPMDLEHHRSLNRCPWQLILAAQAVVSLLASPRLHVNRVQVADANLRLQLSMLSVLRFRFNHVAENSAV